MTTEMMLIWALAGILAVAIFSLIRTAEKFRSAVSEVRREVIDAHDYLSDVNRRVVRTMRYAQSAQEALCAPRIYGAVATIVSDEDGSFHYFGNWIEGSPDCESLDISILPQTSGEIISIDLYGSAALIREAMIGQRIIVSGGVAAPFIYANHPIAAGVQVNLTIRPLKGVQ